MTNTATFDANKALCTTGGCSFQGSVCAASQLIRKADDAMQFTKWIQSDEVEPGSLEKLHFAVFGLGDRSYEKFCSMGHLFHKR